MNLLNLQMPKPKPIFSQLPQTSNGSTMLMMIKKKEETIMVIMMIINHHNFDYHDVFDPT